MRFARASGMPARLNRFDGVSIAVMFIPIISNQVHPFT